MSDEEKEEALSETEIRFRADLLILNSEFPTHRKTEAMEELLEIYNKQSKEIEELKDKNKKLQDKAKELIFEKQELTSALLDSTPNDKIKAKMKEKEWALKNYDCSESDYKQSQAIGAWSVLLSLLKEE